MNQDINSWCPPSVHYLKENKRSALPQRLLFLDTETEANGSVLLGGDLHKFRIGWTWYLRKGRNGHNPEGGTWEFHTDAQKALEYIESKCLKSSPLYIIASNVVFDLGASGFFHYFTRQGWELDFYYSRGLSFILVIHKGALRIKALSIQNFLPLGIKAIGKMIGLPKLDVDFKTTSDEDLKVYCRRDTEILGKGFLYYLSFLQENDCGGFSPTISGQSIRVFRHRFMSERVLIYHQKEVNDMERSAYFGGRTEAFHIGELPREQYLQYDVNSLYPYVMKAQEYPLELLQWRKDLSLIQLSDLLEKYCIVGEVKLQTDVPAYAVKIGGRTTFPIGRFNAVLCSGSLRYALKMGHIRSVGYCLVYRKGTLFPDYVDHFMALRTRYRVAGNELMEKVCKLFANSLYGKFGELRDVLVQDEYTPTDDFIRQVYYNADREVPGIEETLFHRYRRIEGKREGPNSAPAIAAHVTDYGRLALWRLMCAVGREHVLYVDTDSIIIPGKEKARVPHGLIGSHLGGLKVEMESDLLAIYGLKDYVFGDKIVRKGVKEKAVEGVGGVFTQTQFPTLSGLLRLGCDEGVPITEVEKTLSRRYTKGVVTNSGRVIPMERKEF